IRDRHSAGLWRHRRSPDPDTTCVQLHSAGPRGSLLAVEVAGALVEQVAGEIGVSEITVKIHRGHVMRKMGARSLADLVRPAEMLGISRSGPAGA
ncbi:MAG TPA: hypothetical protein DCQ79_00020, partial [Rhizobiales bacterium]|nr:hypothetical protein [Hyphomicrobiales bacterium]